MRKVSKIEQKKKLFIAKKKVAAYARVSKDTQRLMHSASAQVSYYSSLIQKNPDWEYAGVYADYGITGRKVAVRDEFKRMLQDCEDGKIDIILTKSISRFARNTVDLLETVRHLRELDIEVRFEEQNISTMSGDGELMLSILASFAQEESRSISENVKWGVRKRFQSGEIGTANKHLSGYRYDEELEKYIIIPEEAEMVRWMFQMFLDGVSYRIMAKNLNEAGFRTIYGNKFQEASVRQLVLNDVYAGIIRRQKAHVPDPITGKKVINKGELPQYIIENAHEAYLDKETYRRVLEEQKRRESLAAPSYSFTKKIVCGCCGRRFTRHNNKSKGVKRIYWMCRSKKENGTCESRNYKEDELERITASILDLAKFDADTFETRVTDMTVQPNGSIEFHLVGGETKVWKDIGITGHGYTFTVTDCFQGKIFCGKCGSPYHRVVSGGRWCSWYCPARAYGFEEKTCDNDDLRDFDLRQISAAVMEIDEFTEEAFLEHIAEVRVMDSRHLEFRFKDGRNKEWQGV